MLTRATNEQVSVRVSDEGRGIAEEEEAKLFQPFFTTKSQGVGLGLSICRLIVEAHGGTLRAFNNPGARRDLRVRVADREVRRRFGPERTGETRVSEPPAVVHVVDDDDSFRTAIRRQLKTAGYRVKEYAGAAEFLMDPPDEAEASCVLLDLNLPGPSGLDLQEAMVRRGGSLPVIFLTGQGDVRQSVRAMRQGAVDFLTKPTSADELLAAVREALARQAQDADAGRRRREVAARFARLTAREKEVFDDVVAGRLSKQIASRLGISERTIKAHRSRIMTKMEVSSAAELGRAAAELPDRPAPASGPAK